MTYIKHFISEANEEKLRKMLNVSSVGVILFDGDGILIDANDSFSAILGYTREDIESKKLSWRSLTPPEYIEVTEMQMRDLKESGQIGPYEKEYLRKDGLRSLMIFTGTLLEDGIFIKYLIDLSKWKGTHESLRGSAVLLETRNLLTMATRASRIGWGTWDMKNNKIEFDERCREIFGLKKEDISVNKWLELVHPEDRDGLERQIEMAMAKNDTFDVMYRIKLPDGEIRHIHGSGIFEKDSEGVSIRRTGLIQDITNQVRLQQHKDEFLAIASHELKTPISVLKGYLNMIIEDLNKKIDSSSLENLRRADRQINRISKIIDDLLDISLIESGKLQFRKEVFFFDTVVEEAIDSMQFLSANRLRVSGNTGRQVKGDRNRISQVIINMISNAIKYSPSNTEVVITLAKGNDEVILKVEDQGPGIASDKLNNVFDRFSDIDTAPGRNRGLGIGLFISAEIIRKHQGKIWVTSEKGRGSTFGFSLPAK
jgi:two-component system, chemotaxis family, CheB/CheR fusion protein